MSTNPTPKITTGTAGRKGGSRRPRLFAALVALAWLLLAGVGGPLVGKLAEVQKNDNASFLPASAESTEVTNLVAKFSDSTSLPFLIVTESSGALTETDMVAMSGFAKAVPELPFPELGAGRTRG